MLPFFRPPTFFSLFFPPLSIISNTTRYIIIIGLLCTRLAEVFKVMYKVWQATTSVHVLAGCADALREGVGAAAEHADFGHLQSSKKSNVSDMRDHELEMERKSEIGA